MTSFPLKQILVLGLAALSFAAAGCGGDDESKSEPSASSTPTEQSPPPAETVDEAETEEAAEAPAEGAMKLTPDQAQQLLLKNNEAVLGEGGHVQIAENLRQVAEPLGNGPCKKALVGLAAAEEQFGRALAANKPLPLRQKLGQKTLELGGKRDTACN